MQCRSVTNNRGGGGGGGVNRYYGTKLILSSVSKLLVSISKNLILKLASVLEVDKGIHIRRGFWSNVSFLFAFSYIRPSTRFEDYPCPILNYITSSGFFLEI